MSRTPSGSSDNRLFFRLSPRLLRRSYQRKKQVPGYSSAPDRRKCQVETPDKRDEYPPTHLCNFINLFGENVNFFVPFLHQNIGNALEIAELKMWMTGFGMIMLQIAV